MEGARKVEIKEEDKGSGRHEATQEIREEQ